MIFFLFEYSDKIEVLTIPKANACITDRLSFLLLTDRSLKLSNPNLK